MMEDWVLGIWKNGLLVKIMLTGKWKVFINEKLPFKTQHSNIPAFHHSMYEAEFQASKKSFILSKLYKFRDVELSPEVECVA